MGGNRLREVLNRLRWKPEDAGENVALRYTSRVAGAETEVEIPFSHVTEVLAGGVVLANDTFLPYHRLVAVTRGNESLWRAAAEEEL